MPRQATALSALEVKRLVKPGRHPVGTVPGLYLLVREGAQGVVRGWVLRVVVRGKRADIGLGGYPAVPLADAIKTARELREAVAKGQDPLLEKKAARAELMTFRRAAAEYIALHRAGWKNVKHAQQWERTLETYADPVIGAMPVKDIEARHVLEILKPHWTSKNETMVRVRNRVELVLAWAMASGHREHGLNPAAWKGNLDHALPRPSKVNGRTHHAAMPWEELPGFMARLASVEGTSARCLEFAIHTAARSGEARGAVWDEFDLERGVWSIPAVRMKSGRPHRVPLSIQALGVLQRAAHLAGLQGQSESSLVFPGGREGRPLSDMALTALLRRHAPGTTAHGFRSTFRDWTAETTSFPREVAELALAHAVGSSTEQAYARSDLFARRTELMRAWSQWCAPRAPESGRTRSKKTGQL